MYFSRFYDYVKECFLIATILCVAGFLLWWSFAAHMEQSSHFMHDLLLGLADQTEEIQFFPEMEELSLDLRKILLGELEKEEFIETLKRVDITGFGVAPGTWYLLDAARRKENRKPILRALNNRLLPEDLKIVEVPLFPYWATFIVWFFIGISTFLGYAYYCRTNRDNLFADTPWPKAWVYPAILIMAPGLLIFFTIYSLIFVFFLFPKKGLVKLIAISREWQRAQRQAELEAQRESLEVETEAISEEAEEVPREERLERRAGMRWLVLEDYLTEKEHLREAGIVFTELSISEPHELTGIAFPESELDKVLETLAIRPVRTETIDTNWPDVCLLQIEGRQAFRQTRKEAFEERRALYRERYVTECRRRIDQETDSARNKVSELETEVERHRMGLVKNSRELKFQLTKFNSLESLSMSEELRREKFGQEFDKFCEMPHIEWLEISDGRIRLYTDTVQIDYEGVRYKVGDFEIVIYVDGDLKVNNLTHRVGQCDHPHIMEGKPCLGNLSESIAKLTASYQFDIVAQMMVEFLYSINPEGWFKSIRDWKGVMQNG